jgi:hypothetical protein
VVLAFVKDLTPVIPLTIPAGKESLEGDGGDEGATASLPPRPSA